MAESNNYVVGRGRLYFDRFPAGLLVGTGFRYFGNTPELMTSQAAQSLEHYSSDDGMKFKDASVDLSNDMSGSFTCDNINPDNLALFFLGEVSAQTITSQGAVAAAIVGTFSGTGTAGDSITINSQVIDFVASGATGFQINVGATATDTAQNFKTLINNNPATFGVVATGAAAIITLTAVVAGLVGNALAISESGTGFSFAGAAVFLAGGADSPTETLTDVVLGRYYPLGVSTVHPQGLRGVTVTSVLIGATPVLGPTNWEVDSVTGLLHVLEDSPDIAAGADLIVAYNVAGGTRNMIIGENNVIYGAMRFYSRNPTGRQKDYFWPYLKLSPNGDMNLKGDDWQVVGFKFEVLKLDDATDRVYIDDRGV